MPVDNNEHQRIDDLSTDCVPSLERKGFAL